MIELIGGREGPFDRSKNLGSNCWNFWRNFGQSTDCLAAWVVICALNYVLMCMMPEMAMEFGFTKRNRYWMDNPLFCFRDC